MRPQPTFIGYFPKRVAIPPGPSIPPQVVQLCNVGHCAPLDPDGWSEAWAHNELSVYDSEELAWGVVPAEQLRAFELHAYLMFPLLFVNGIEQAITLPTVHPDPLPVHYERIGYDPVSFPALLPDGQNVSKVFGHSSLSPFCNGGWHSIEVNQFCLLDEPEEAFLRAKEFSGGRGEPEPYTVVEVWRRKLGRAEEERRLAPDTVVSAREGICPEPTQE